MYCVIQKVTNKKSSSIGAPKELIVNTIKTEVDGIINTKYYYGYSEDRFQRNVKDAYKISIHKSYRENGKVKKRQWVICTLSYYDIVDYGAWIGEYCTNLEEKLCKIGITEETLCDMVYDKLNRIAEDIKSDYEKSEEYLTREKHKEVLKRYHRDKEIFENVYGANTYDYCFDVFRVLRNEDYLNNLRSTKKQYENNYSGYYEEFKSNYSDFFLGDNRFRNISYTEKEKDYLKVIYKAAALKLHPDISKDSGEGMKFLNKLKEEWGI